MLVPDNLPSPVGHRVAAGLPAGVVESGPQPVHDPASAVCLSPGGERIRATCGCPRPRRVRPLIS